MGDAVVESRDGRMLTLVLNRPEKRNPLALDLMRELTARVQSADDDAGVGVVVLGAAGPVFSAGHDLRELTGRDEAFYEEVFDACAELMLTIHSIAKPVIARVQGMATAAGCQLVAACDLAVASEEARFATPGVKIGLFCTTPMVEVARAVGRKRAMEMLLTGDPIDAATAADWGLVNRVVPAVDLDVATAELAQRIATASPVTLGIGKRAFWENIDMTLPAAYRHASETMCRNAVAGDAQEGMTAFIEKRPAVWGEK
jgi:enoyl-CoA hydratase/carnithine racemase